MLMWPIAVALIFSTQHSTHRFRDILRQIATKQLIDVSAKKFSQIMQRAFFFKTGIIGVKNNS